MNVDKNKQSQSPPDEVTCFLKLENNNYELIILLKGNYRGIST